MKTIAFLTVAAFMVATTTLATAAEGTLDAPIELQLSPDGRVVERQARIDKNEVGSAYEFTLSEWSDLAVAIPAASGKLTLTLLRENEATLSVFEYEPAKGPLRLTSGPGKYRLWMQRQQQEAVDYTLQLSALATAPRSSDRPGDRVESAKDIGMLQPGARALTERTDTGGGHFFYRFNLPDLSHFDTAIQATDAPVKLTVRGEDSAAYTGSDALNPNRLEAVLKPGRYTLDVSVLAGNTDFRLDIKTASANALPAHLVAGSDMASARPIGQIGTEPHTLDGVLRTADNQANWYSLSLDAPATLNVNPAPSSDRNIVIQVIDPEIGLPNGLAMPRWHQDDGRISFNLAKGNHLLRVMTYEGGANYALELRAEPKR